MKVGDIVKFKYGSGPVMQVSAIRRTDEPDDAVVQVMSRWWCDEAREFKNQAFSPFELRGCSG